MMATPTNLQLKSLAKDVIKLVFESNKLKENKGESEAFLDRAYENSRIDASPHYRGGVINQDMPEVEQAIRKLMNPDSRFREFEILFHEIDQLEFRTEIIVSCYDPLTDAFDLNRFQLLNDITYPDFPALIRNVELYLKIISTLNSMYMFDQIQN